MPILNIDEAIGWCAWCRSSIWPGESRSHVHENDGRSVIKPPGLIDCPCVNWSRSGEKGKPFDFAQHHDNCDGTGKPRNHVSIQLGERKDDFSAPLSGHPITRVYSVAEPYEVDGRMHLRLKVHGGGASKHWIDRLKARRTR